MCSRLIELRPPTRAGYHYTSWGVLHEEITMCLLEHRPGPPKVIEGHDWYEVRWRNLYSIAWRDDWNPSGVYNGQP